MERYIVNIIFKTEMFEKVSNIVEKVKIMKEAMSFKLLKMGIKKHIQIKLTIT